MPNNSSVLELACGTGILTRVRIGWVDDALSSDSRPLLGRHERNIYTTVKQRGEWWIGRIEEVPGVNAQERTEPDLLASLREVLREALESLSISR